MNKKIKRRRVPESYTIAERLEFYSMPEPNSGCWIWFGSIDSRGYGQIGIEGKLRLAHRLSWEVNRGPIEKNLCVLHRCDTPVCINPDHLFLGTHKDNSDDMISKGRQNFLKGEAHYKAQLTENDVLDIRHSKESRNYLCKKYRVSYYIIADIQNHRSWRHLP